MNGCFVPSEEDVFFSKEYVADGAWHPLDPCGEVRCFFLDQTTVLSPRRSSDEPILPVVVPTVMCRLTHRSGNFDRRYDCIFSKGKATRPHVVRSQWLGCFIIGSDHIKFCISSPNSMNKISLRIISIEQVVLMLYGTVKHSLIHRRLWLQTWLHFC